MKKLLIILLLATSSIQSKIILINLSEQMLYAKEKGKIIFEGRISSGKRGHETDIGKFKITEKKRKHKSTLYPKPSGGASMPFMLRLSHSAVAIHLGPVPTYPASHGCIRVNRNLAQRLFAWTTLGTPVVIKGKAHKRERTIVSNTRFNKITDDKYDLLEYYDDDAEMVEVY